MSSHAMMNMLVAFLLVTRISISVSRYNDCRAELGKMMREIRELLQYMVILTRQMHEPSDKTWRNETTYRAICLLQSSMAVLDYPSLDVPAWKIPELDEVRSKKRSKESLEYEFGLDKEECHTMNTMHRCEFHHSWRFSFVGVSIRARNVSALK